MQFESGWLQSAVLSEGEQADKLWEKKVAEAELKRVKMKLTEVELNRVKMKLPEGKLR